jgi:AcrR family transcriptional regulator
MNSTDKRPYHSVRRAAAAKRTRARMLAEAKRLFAARGIEEVTVNEIAAAAEVSPATFFNVFKSREGILAALMNEFLFGAHTTAALKALEGVTDPVEALRRTAGIARSIYAGEARELGDVREIAGSSLTLRNVEKAFDDRRMMMQAPRIRALFDAGRARRNLSPEVAARLLWMYTSRDVYRLLTVDGGWSGDAYETWLADTLIEALTEPEAVEKV